MIFIYSKNDQCLRETVRMYKVRAYADINSEIIERLLQSVIARFRQCIIVEGHHFEHLQK